jgi:hypothetical protein
MWVNERFSSVLMLALITAGYWAEHIGRAKRLAPSFVPAASLRKPLTLRVEHSRIT